MHEWKLKCFLFVHSWLFSSVLNFLTQGFIFPSPAHFLFIASTRPLHYASTIFPTEWQLFSLSHRMTIVYFFARSHARFFLASTRPRNYASTIFTEPRWLRDLKGDWGISIFHRNRLEVPFKSSRRHRSISKPRQASKSKIILKINKCCFVVENV